MQPFELKGCIVVPFDFQKDCDSIFKYYIFTLNITYLPRVPFLSGLVFFIVQTLEKFLDLEKYQHSNCF